MSSTFACTILVENGQGYGLLFRRQLKPDIIHRIDKLFFIHVISIRKKNVCSYRMGRGEQRVLPLSPRKNVSLINATCGANEQPQNKIDRGSTTSADVDNRPQPSSSLLLHSENRIIEFHGPSQLSGGRTPRP